MRRARPLAWILLVMIVLWAIAGWLWPTAVLYYFAIAGVILALFALGHDIKRELEKHWRP